MATGADALSFDLEDSVHDTKKDQARQAVAAFLHQLPSGPRKTMIVRVNGLGTPHFESDLEAIVGSGLDMINLPKAQSAADIRICVDALERFERVAGVGPIGLLPNIESPKGVRLAAEIASSSTRIVGLQIGWGDLLEPLNIDRRNRSATAMIQLAVRMAAAEAGVPAYDSIFTDIKDPDGFRRDAEAARQLGYTGKSLIHPSQVPIANEIFLPTAVEIAYALRVVQAAREASAKGIGAFTVDGNMVDAPFVHHAEGVLRTARESGLLDESGAVRKPA